MTGPALKIVADRRPARAAKPSQLQKTRALARAFANEARALAALHAARAEIDTAFPAWAAGRSIDRDQAREQLVSTGHMPRTKVWER